MQLAMEMLTEICRRASFWPAATAAAKAATAVDLAGPTLGPFPQCLLGWRGERARVFPAVISNQQPKTAQ